MSYFIQGLEQRADEGIEVMDAVVVDATTGERLTFFADAAVLRATAGHDASPLRRIASVEYEWAPIDGEKLTKASLACELYMWGATYDEIAALFGVTRERVRQILSKQAPLALEEIKRQRRVNAAAIASESQSVHSNLIAEYLSTNGPSSIDEVASGTALSRSAVKLAWPSNFAHLQLAHLKKATHQTWTDDQILEALRSASMYEFPLTRAKYDALQSVGQISGPTGVRVMQRFGTWTAACDRAGVQAGVARAAPYESRWTDEELLKFASDYLRSPAYGGTFSGYDTWRRRNSIDGPSSGTLRNRLGAWSAIKRRALEMIWSADE